MTAPRTQSLGISLFDPRSGGLVRTGALRRDGLDIRFIVDEAYLRLGPDRPVLSSAWVQVDDDGGSIERLRRLDDKWSRQGILPPWFSNLLPEGALRTLVEEQLGSGRHDEFDVLAALGRDLPGAVFAVAEDMLPMAMPLPAPRPPKDGEAPLIKFSLAGVQLKLSMRRSGERVTYPASGEAGDVIVKLPSETYPGLPEAEHLGMTLAQAAGVETAACRLVPIERILGLPAEWRAIGRNALIVDRFDRSAAGRIHLEDFAQILGAPVGDWKYTRGNEQTVLKASRLFAADGVRALLEATRRSVVNILVGNGDAHLKNWALSYPGGRQAQLSPAYDVVPTILFGDDGSLAMTFFKKKKMEQIELALYERAAKFMKLDPRILTNAAKDAVERAASAWPAVVAEADTAEGTRTTLARHWDSLALTKGYPNPFG